MMSRDPKRSAVMDQPDVHVEHALRIVLVIALSRDEAALLVQRSDVEDPVTLWPSSLYGWLTRQMLTSRRSWRCGASHLDHRLFPWLERFSNRSAMELADALAEGREAWSAQELAALLWALLRREEPAWWTVLRRLSAEIEIAVLQMTMRPCLDASAARRTTKPRLYEHRRPRQLAPIAGT